MCFLRNLHPSTHLILKDACLDSAEEKENDNEDVKEEEEEEEEEEEVEATTWKVIGGVRLYEADRSVEYYEHMHRK